MKQLIIFISIFICSVLGGCVQDSDFDYGPSVIADWVCSSDQDSSCTVTRKVEFKYTQAGVLSELITFDVDEGIEEKKSAWTFSYENNLLKKIIERSYSTAETVEEFSFYYSSEGLLERIDQIGFQAGADDLTGKVIFTYDTDGRLSNYTYNLLNDDTNFEGSATYFNDGKVETHELKNYGNFLDGLTEFIYNDNNLLQEMVKVWANTSISKVVYDYTESGRIDQGITYYKMPDSDQSQYEKDSKMVYEYFDVFSQGEDIVEKRTWYNYNSAQEKWVKQSFQMVEWTMNGSSASFENWIILFVFSGDFFSNAFESKLTPFNSGFMELFGGNPSPYAQ